MLPERLLSFPQGKGCVRKRNVRKECDIVCLDGAVWPWRVKGRLDPPRRSLRTLAQMFPNYLLPSGTRTVRARGAAPAAGADPGGKGGGSNGGPQATTPRHATLGAF